MNIKEILRQIPKRVTWSIKHILLLSALMLSTVTSISAENPKTILVWGDSLSAAYGIRPEQGWVKLLADELSSQARIINASISGETTQGGVSRLPSALHQHKPDYVILELGGNDALRGYPITEIRKNLNTMLENIKTSGAQPILFGMKIPPNYGFKYTQEFEKIFSDLAKQHKVIFLPFFLEGVANKFEYMQLDGIHPTAEAQTLLLDNVRPTITKALGGQ
ncbi:MAG: Arylesterase precursor (EC [uncultured Thiotrichaceae bacterium]|uniref:Arylesterase (EC) n=1 Tax=uncultured Thiotrichaceae bacterium TaxID=298394 RepID=A0A6S6TN51_9GAMM|nr:MAG: Arylesterase precursor (EC [uncultured Thiotrichaceae bacterium]